MKVLVTGSNGFIGKHVCRALLDNDCIVLKYDRENSLEELREFIKVADWIVHLAGSMRPIDKKEYYEDNTNLTKTIADIIIQEKVEPSIIFASSIQSSLNNDYGVSKLQAENCLFELSSKTNCSVAIFRLTNAFGKWGRPNYNSVVSTFCYNISHNLPIKINDERAVVNFIYIDDIVNTFVGIIKGNYKYENKNINSIYPYYPISIGELAKTLYRFKNIKESNYLPLFDDEFERKLYATFISYYDVENLSFDNESFQAFQTFSLPSLKKGAFYVEELKINEMKWNHYHETTIHRLTNITGKCLIKLSNLNGQESYEYSLNEYSKTIIDIPPGFIHSITNVGDTNCFVLMWTSNVNEK